MITKQYLQKHIENLEVKLDILLTIPLCDRNNYWRADYYATLKELSLSRSRLQEFET